MRILSWRSSPRPWHGMSLSMLYFPSSAHRGAHIWAGIHGHGCDPRLTGSSQFVRATGGGPNRGGLLEGLLAGPCFSFPFAPSDVGVDVGVGVGVGAHRMRTCPCPSMDVCLCVTARILDSIQGFQAPVMNHLDCPSDPATRANMRKLSWERLAS